MRRSYRPLNPDINPETGYPLDWEQDKQFHGVSRSNTARRYLVRVSAAGKQHAIGSASSQLEAARMFDLANWKLAAFIRKTRFNFPESLPEYTVETVSQRAPYLDGFYAECCRLRPLNPDLTEREHREAAFERVSTRGAVADRRSAAGSWSAVTQAVGRASADALRLRLRVSRLAGKLKLNKLPALQQQLSEFEAQLTQLNEAGVKLFYNLERHAPLYAKTQAEENV